MSNVLSITGMGIAAGAALVALYALARNWIWFARREHAPEDSPLLLVAPLFSLIASGIFAQAFPVAAGWEVWLFPVFVSLVDPAGLPLILSALIKADSSRESD